MPDIGELIRHWGYLAVFLAVVLGNVGLPVPEETVLVVAGYLTWTGRLRLPLVLMVGVASAVVGDNVGYWLGRRFGSAALERYGQRVLVSRQRLELVRRVVARHGALAVFAARFLPGLRFLAGPVAGATGLAAGKFMAANVLGALLYVPVAVATGYAVGYGLGPQLEPLRRTVGELELLVLAGAVIGTVVVLVRRRRRARAGGGGPRRSG